MINKFLKSSLFKSTLIYTVSDAINKAVPFFVLPILSYYLTPKDYGIVTNFNILVGILNILAALSIDGVISVHYYKISKEDLAKFLFNGISLVILSTAILAVFCSLFRDRIYDGLQVPIEYVYLAIFMTFANTMSTVNLTIWRLEEKPFKFGGYKIALTIVNTSVSLLLVIAVGLGWKGSVDGTLIATILFGFLSLFLLWRRGYFVPQFDKKIRLAILSFGLPLIPHSLSMWVRSAIDRIYISNFYSVADTGLYATGFQFGILVSFVMMAFNNAFVPYLYKKLSVTDEHQLKQNENGLKKVTYIGVGLLVIGSAIFYLISIFVLNRFYSVSYRGAKPFILWAIVAQFFQGLYLFAVNYIFFVKKTKSLAIITFSCSLVQVLLSYFLIKDLGPIGGAYSTVIVSGLNFVCVAWYSNKVYPMAWFKFKTVIKNNEEQQ
ncbi:Membrane protein involved in the export of O-antigen and teichoic acid [Arachidicoccus rhizosphaerae]|uniref:Membrane protein involved in the export of O-antigen and teichoic acid n=1 Tax=Arachidicoccus rhizosphaerae TaxID=551991 RepID=A0A1H4CP86_9BACT|nr:oligosaccharide flippase family protein [Arachidicoccus rhizosphaerae]SEA62160.1 Membrane protein involved in the export of O-antigen and teichoic acid [Arachidicoccus rhizosphaerae]